MTRNLHSKRELLCRLAASIGDTDMLNDLPNPTTADDCLLQAPRPLSWLRKAHQEHLTLCRELEDIADSLPSSVNRQKCIYAAKALGPSIRDIQHYEETVLYPWLKQRSSDPAFDTTLERLKFEHFEDSCFAEELTDILLKLGAGVSVNTEAVGYMLRGYFETVRRHIAFERDFLLKDFPEDTLVAAPR